MIIKTRGEEKPWSVGTDILAASRRKRKAVRDLSERVSCVPKAAARAGLGQDRAGRGDV